ncbi:MAG TPA: dihydrolipoamide acetyltransferase family protein [Candidatus Acidoferrum sp.]|jgi:2-oxoisovalerate dehydrogenase E2 component (dihydrolipoyl transacylase)|nr:dihydrolipoamide acetyltransferase family protein [Candidatus Acidoferrum sp.]
MAGTDKRVVMPQLGESVHEGTISKWLVKPGDKVVEFEPMLEVDTDKVSAEVPAPVTGILKEILAKEGETVQAGAEIAVVEVGGDGAAPAEGNGQPAKAEAKTEAKKAPAAQAIATPEAPAPPPHPAKAAVAATQAPEAEAPAAPAPAAEPAPSEAPAATLSGGEHRYSPAVQMAASELKVDLSKLEGTGIGGRVTKKDVQDFAAAAKAAPPAAKPSPASTPFPPGEGDEVIQLTRVRRLIGENMTRSKTTIPHAWQTQEADMSGVVANRNANKTAFQQQEDFPLTYLPYVMAATASALREHREVNSTFHDTELIVHRDINLGVSIGLEDTLVVPVVRRADGLSIAGLARAVNDIATRARNKQLKADDLAGATFTVNNSGTFGTLFSYSVINPGQAGILTMEAIVERPVAVKGMIGIKPMMYLCFSFDHRILDGLQGARFLVSCRKWLETVTAESPIY